MKILIEDHLYDSPLIENVLDGYKIIDNPIHHVGYFFNKALNDCVFFLPKVIMDENDMVFGKYTPEEIIDIDKLYDKNILSIEERDFLYNFSIWIYRVIDVYRRNNPDSSLVKKKTLSQIDRSTNEVSSTILDIIISLVKFSKENQNFFVHTFKEAHTGVNKINWNRTINKGQPIIQNGKKPIYLNPVNQKKTADLDEELFVIFFSILNYINKKFGFKTPIEMRYQLMSEAEFEKYQNGFGLVKLRQIKYKYFSDRLLKMWDLCYLFFDTTSKITSFTQSEDYLIVNNFNIVFEKIIDELISDKDIPKPLKEQSDGKIVDHIYRYQSVVNDDGMYYIGDSKYYKIGHNVSAQAEYKQYTYAKNVIQFNLDLFIDINNQKQVKFEPLPYRDKITEGYNISPNFFISAEIDTVNFDYENDNLTHRSDQDRCKIQFENRLFDRDTLWLSHYDINFLFVIAKYVNANDFTKEEYKEEVRRKFRKEIMELLSQRYSFYIIEQKSNEPLELTVNRYFRLINGKVYCPSRDKNCKHLILALEKGKKFQDENETLISIISHDFIIHQNYKLGENTKKYTGSPLES